jgi:hypothetical protein
VAVERGGRGVDVASLATRFLAWIRSVTTLIRRIGYGIRSSQNVAEVGGAFEGDFGRDRYETLGLGGGG